MIDKLREIYGKEVFFLRLPIFQNEWVSMFVIDLVLAEANWQMLRKIDKQTWEGISLAVQTNLGIWL